MPRTERHFSCKNEHEGRIYMKYDTIVFDFDGTLFDTGEGIKKNIARAISEMGYAPLPEEKLAKFIGPSLLVAFKEHCGMTEKEAVEAIDAYRREYDSEGFKLSKPFDGIIELLTKLKEMGVKTVVASAKPQYILDPTVDYFGVRHYFDRVLGSEEEGRPSNSKKELIKRAMLGGKCVMVGDSSYDIEGGIANGIDTIAVTYGFGIDSVADAKALNPTYIACSVEELSDILLS